jgi:hypothetical protein
MITVSGFAARPASIMVPGIRETVEVRYDPSGTPHIHAHSTFDLFFVHGFLAARDHMLQMEMWRRTREGKLAAALGPDYIEKDKVARGLGFRGDWNAEFRKYHSEGSVVFDAFSRGVNAAIHMALEQQQVPVEFQKAGFQPEAVWTAKTVLGRSTYSDRQLIHVKGKPEPLLLDVSKDIGIRIDGTPLDAEPSFRLALTDSVTAQGATEVVLLYPENEDEAIIKGAAFERVQTGVFSDESPVVVVWGDYDNDGWPDLFVGYAGGMAKLFHNDRGSFTDVSIGAGITDSNFVRSAAWGDFDADGNLDLYIGFESGASTPNRLYKSDGHGHFVDVAASMGVNDWGSTRQSTFIDFNNDGRPDLFVAFREKESRLYRNDGDHFTEVAKQMGITGAHNTVGAVWFDYNEDGRLDLFEADQNGKPNVVYRNDGDHFTEVARDLGMDGGDRSVELGSVSIAVGDFNNDGRLDLYFANYGPSWLMRNDGGGKFTDVAPQMGVSVDRHLVSAGWGDYDNDGKLDLYADGYLAGHPNIRDYLFHNEGNHFTDVTPDYILKNDADHAVTWVDFDRDGALDLALANHESGGRLSLYRNRLPAEQAKHSLAVMVLDRSGHYTKAGAEVRLYEAGTRNPIAAALVDTGSGYDGQSVIPIHFGLGRDRKVDVEVTTMSAQGRVVTRVPGVSSTAWTGKVFTIRAR